MINIINCVQGYSASSRKDNENISSVVKDIVKKKKIKGYFNYFEGNEAGLIKNSVEFISSTTNFLTKSKKDYNLFFIGKSMGGPKTFYIYRKLFKHHKKVLDNAKKIRVLFVDPHGSCILDLNPVPISSLRKMKLYDKWQNSRTQFFNIYQQDKYPKGGYVVGAKNEKITGVDHFEIDTCKQVKNEIKNILAEIS